MRQACEVVAQIDMRNSSGDALVGMLVLAEGALGEDRIHVSFT